MIKELILLIKLLFSSNAPKNAKAEFLTTKYFPPKGFLYLMWCGKLVHRRENIRTIGCLSSKQKEILLHHEQIHIDQATTLGSWFKYYLAYFWEWLKGISFRKKSAYYTNRFEVEAYAKEADMNYVGTASKRFSLANRRRTFREHFKTWKSWLKTYFKD